MAPLTVNEVLARRDELLGQPVVVRGLLSADGCYVLQHYPKAERRSQRSMHDIGIEAGEGLSLNHEALARWVGKRVCVSGDLNGLSASDSEHFTMLDGPVSGLWITAAHLQRI